MTESRLKTITHTATMYAVLFVMWLLFAAALHYAEGYGSTQRLQAVLTDDSLSVSTLDATVDVPASASVPLDASVGMEDAPCELEPVERSDGAMLDDVFVTNTALLLAKLCKNEAGWRALDDCAAIGHIRIRSAARHGRTLADELIALHGTRSLNPYRADRNQYIASLAISYSPPTGWPYGSAWENVASDWVAMLKTAQGVIDGTVPDPCAGSPTRVYTWGGPSVDREMLSKPSWHTGICVGTFQNVFGGHFR